MYQYLQLWGVKKRFFEKENKSGIISLGKRKLAESHFFFSLKIFFQGSEGGQSQKSWKF